MSKEQRGQIKYAAANLMHREMRKAVQRSVRALVDYFEGFKTYEQLRQKSGLKPKRETFTLLTDFNLPKKGRKLTEE
jgi:hypothetical protein